MIDTRLYTDIEKDKKKLSQQSNPQFATVVEITQKGVKLKIDGEEEARETYYNSVTQVGVGDRVYINYVSGTILVIGNLTNPGGEGGVSKEYVDEQDEILDGKIGVLEKNSFKINGYYTGNIDELFLSGEYKLDNPFSGTMPDGQSLSTIRHGVIVVHGDSSTGGSIIQELHPTNHVAYPTYIGKHYIRIRFGGEWGEWKEVVTTSKINNLPLLNGWENYSPESEGFQTAKCYKVGNRVFLTGLIRNGVSTAHTIFTTLPPEFRPKRSIIQYVSVGDGSRAYRVNMYPNGEVAFNQDSPLASAYLSLEEISFLIV